MKALKIVATVVLIYVGIVVAFETLIGYFQPTAGSTLVITTFEGDGTPHDRVVSGLESDGQLYVAANHWPRAWYDRALENPEVHVTLDGEKMLPVALIAHVFTEQPEKTFSNLELKARAQQLIDQLEAVGAHVYIPRSDRDYAISVGLRMLTLRHLVLEDGNLYRAAADELLLLRYYANTISHFVPLAAAPAEEPASARAGNATEREQPSREPAS